MLSCKEYTYADEVSRYQSFLSQATCVKTFGGDLNIPQDLLNLYKVHTVAM